METYAERVKAERLEEEVKRNRQRVDALKFEIKKYQTSIKNIQEEIIDFDGKGDLTEQARSQYKRIIKDCEKTIIDYTMQIRQSQENLAEIYVRMFMLPPPTQRADIHS